MLSIMKAFRFASKPPDSGSVLNRKQTSSFLNNTLFSGESDHEAMKIAMTWLRIANINLEPLNHISTLYRPQPRLPR